jgi:hypothetical protein
VRVLKNNRGASLITVMVVTMVLILLVAVILRVSYEGLVITKVEGKVDNTYSAGESVSQKWFNELRDYLDDGSYVDDYNGGDVDPMDGNSRKLYAEHVIKSIVEDTGISGDFVLNVESNLNQGRVKNSKIELINHGYDSTVDKLILQLGIEADADYDVVSRDGSRKNSIVNKKVYSVKNFHVTYPTGGFKLEAAIYSVGDIMLNGNKQNGFFNVYGDIFSMGSYAQYRRIRDQYYYGGNMVVNAGNFNIYGNAYSRSFNRVGIYQKYSRLGMVYDNNKFFTLKDSFSQNLHSFGAGDLISIGRNTYTFDDVESNAVRSNIAINGSLFGLTNVEKYKGIDGVGSEIADHDASSGIVNSASIHGYGSAEGLESKVAILGDISLGGTTFKITPAGRKIGEIEAASVAWYIASGNGLAFYTFFDKDKNADWSEYNNTFYKAYFQNPSDFKNDLNLIQVRNRFGTNEGIDSIANILAFKAWSQTLDQTNSSPQISGFASASLAANDKLYLTSNDAVEANRIVIGGIPSANIMKNFAFINKAGYQIDNIYESATSNRIKYNNAFWSGIDTTSDRAKEKTLENMKLIKSDLMNKIQVFLRRDYPMDKEGEDDDNLSTITWDISTFEKNDKDTEAQKNKKKVFGDTLNKLANRITALSTNPVASEYTVLVPQNSTYGDQIDVNDLYNQVKGRAANPANIYAERDPNYSLDKKYYLVVNKDEGLTITVNGTFNGIIYSTGKVILNDGAKVRGAIVSGYGDDVGTKYVNGYFEPRPKAINSEGDVTNLNQGRYAGVYISSNTAISANAPSVDFFLGLYDQSGDTDLLNDSESIETKELRILQEGQRLARSQKERDEAQHLNRAGRINLLNKFLNNQIDLFNIL